MIAHENQWYVGWFRWSCRVLDKALPQFDYRRTTRYAKGTNLCHFFRTLMWGTGLALFCGGTWIYLLYVVLIQPWILFPALSVATVAGGIIALVTAVFILMAALFWIIEGGKRLIDWLDGHKWNPGEEKAGFGRVVGTYAKGLKDRFCPTISFKETNGDVP